MVKLQLGHWFLLESIGSPLVTEKEVSCDDAIKAALICSQTYAESERSLNAWWMGIFVRYWLWRIGSKIDVIEEHQKFDVYLSAMLHCPNLQVENGKTDIPGMPWHWRLLAFLMGDMNMPERDALAMPIARANALWAADAERKGHGQVKDGYRNRSFVSMVKELEARGERPTFAPN